MAETKLAKRQPYAKKVALAAAIYGGMWLLTFAGICGQSQWDCQNRFQRICNQYRAREETSFAAVMGALPHVWIAALATTGFYQHGFRLGVTAANPIPEGQKQ